MADFDVGAEHVREHFIGKIDYPDKWQIGLIVGGSGTGKSTIAKELYNEALEDDFVYPDKPVIDCIPCHNVEELQKNVLCGWVWECSFLAQALSCFIKWRKNAC